MKLRNVLYGLFLCSVVSSVCAGDTDVFQMIDEQENRTSEEVPNKGVTHADLGEIDDEHPLSNILDASHHAAHREEEFKPNNEKPVGKADGFAFSLFRDLSKQHLFALTAGAMFVGYCIYKVWNMFVVDAIEQIEQELKVTLTYQDRETLFNLLQAMAQDIENLRENKHEICAVGQIDVSLLSEVIAPECKVLCSNFVELYNAIDRSGNNIEIIIMFYGEFERAVQALLLQAKII